MIRICLDKALSEYNISRYELSKRTGIQYQIIDNYYKNKLKRYDGFVLERICTALDCNINDIIEFIKDWHPALVEKGVILYAKLNPQSGKTEGFDN